LFDFIDEVIGIFDKGTGIPYQGFKIFSKIFGEMVSETSNSVDNGSYGKTLFVNFGGSINARGVGIGFDKILNVVFFARFY